MSITHSRLQKSEQASAEIAAHIREFKKRGGKIEKIPAGMSAEAYELEISAATGLAKWKGLNGTEHMRKKNYGSKRKGRAKNAQ